MAGAGMVIVGAGEAGMRAAFALRESGHEGPVTLIGGESAPPYERPPLSKSFMQADGAPRAIAGAGRFDEAGIEYRGGVQVRAVNRGSKSVELEDGSVIAYEKLLLATGARPRQLPGLAASPRVLALRTIDDALALRRFIAAGRRIAILGGGFIGLELAASARQAGAGVVLLEAQPRLLMRGVPAEIATLLHDRHRREGVDIRCGTTVRTIEPEEERVRITLADGTGIEAHALVVGIGAEPDTALAQAAGLDCDNGITVNGRLQTSDPDIFAAGDCCSFPLACADGRRVRLESWRNAQEQGGVAAANMLGAASDFRAVPWFWSDQYDQTLQVAGLAEPGATAVQRVTGPEQLIVFHIAADGRLASASGLGPGNSIARDIRIAEMLIAAGARPDPSQLSDPHFKLKSLL